MPAPFSTTYAVDIAATFPRFQYSKSFQRIQKLLDTQDLVKALLKQLDTIVEAAFKKNQNETGYTHGFAMFDTLREVEKKNGFNQNEVKYLLGVLDAKEFGGMVRLKCAFLDPFVTPRHGAESHRIQWWMIAQDMKKNAAMYDAGVDAGTLFAAAQGPLAFINKEDNVWYHTLDAGQGKCTSARAPESLKEHFMTKGLYPAISEAEKCSMTWDTTAKMGFAKWKGLATVGRNLEKNLEVKPLGKLK